MTAPAFDPVIHPEPRLRICAFLLPTEQVGFAKLRDELGFSDSQLSKHLKTLVEAGYVTTTKEGNVPRPRTWVMLTDDGRAATQGHLAVLRDLAATVQPSA